MMISSNLSLHHYCCESQDLFLPPHLATAAALMSRVKKTNILTSAPEDVLAAHKVLLKFLKLFLGNDKSNKHVNEFGTFFFYFLFFYFRFFLIPILLLSLSLSLSHTHTHTYTHTHTRTLRTLQGTLFKREICVIVLWDSHHPCTERATLSCVVTITETTEEIRIVRSFVMMTLLASHSLTLALNVCCSTVLKLTLSCSK